MVFQFSLPVWGAIGLDGIVAACVKISIPVPCVGNVFILTYNAFFQFTLPVWGAILSNIFQNIILFQFTLPAWGAIV